MQITTILPNCGNLFTTLHHFRVHFRSPFLRIRSCYTNSVKVARERSSLAACVQKPLQFRARRFEPLFDRSRVPRFHLRPPLFVAQCSAFRVSPVRFVAPFGCPPLPWVIRIFKFRKLLRLPICKKFRKLLKSYDKADENPPSF